MVYCEFSYRLRRGGSIATTKQNLEEATQAAAWDWVKKHYGSSAEEVEIVGPVKKLR